MGAATELAPQFYPGDRPAVHPGPTELLPNAYRTLMTSDRGEAILSALVQVFDTRGGTMRYLLHLRSRVGLAIATGVLLVVPAGVLLAFGSYDCKNCSSLCDQQYAQCEANADTPEESNRCHQISAQCHSRCAYTKCTW